MRVDTETLWAIDRARYGRSLHRIADSRGRSRPKPVGKASVRQPPVPSSRFADQFPEAAATGPLWTGSRSFRELSITRYRKAKLRPIVRSERVARGRIGRDDSNAMQEAR